MAREVFFDTSGFFALLDSRDSQHRAAVGWVEANRSEARPVTTEWVVGETCTLLVARNRPHLMGQYLDQLERSPHLVLLNPDGHLISAAKRLIRRQADQGYSFVDCLSFCAMEERGIREALTTDAHFRKAGFKVLLACGVESHSG